MKVSELSGGELDLWVSRAEKRKPDMLYMPSTDWAVGGPIIERERPTLEPGLQYGGANTWKAWIRNDSGFHYAYGQTALIAAMRAYVASKFGEEVLD